MDEMSQVQPKKSGWAIASLLFGICFFIPFAFLMAIIFGIIGLVKISKSKGALKGQAMAIVGLCLGALQFLLIPIMALLLAIAIPNFIRAKQNAEAVICVENLKKISAAKQMYIWEKGLTMIPPADSNGIIDGDGIPDAIELYIGKRLTCPAGGKYIICPLGVTPTCSLGGRGTEWAEDDHVLKIE